MEKLWAECSQAEKDEVKQIEDDQYKAYWLYGHRLINHRKYSYRLTRLIRRLDEVERKYGTEAM